MDVGSYAKRNADAHEAVRAALARFGSVKGFEDAEAALTVTPSRDPAVYRLFELEAIAAFVGRLADHYAPPVKESKEAKAQREAEAQGVQGAVYIPDPDALPLPNVRAVPFVSAEYDDEEDEDDDEEADDLADERAAKAKASKPKPKPKTSARGK